MQKASFELVPTPEFRAEVERIANQWAGLIRLSITGFVDTLTLVIQAKYCHKGEMLSIWVDVRNGTNLEDRVATLLTRFYNELVKTFEPDFVPVENF